MSRGLGDVYKRQQQDCAVDTVYTSILYLKTVNLRNPAGKQWRVDEEVIKVERGN